MKCVGMEAKPCHLIVSSKTHNLHTLPVEEFSGVLKGIGDSFNEESPDAFPASCEARPVTSDD